MRTGVLIVGVGGQGVLTLARILGEAALAAGLPVCVGQQHGMSQRGGSVEATVVIGAAVRSPFLGDGEANVLVALDPVEAARAAPRLAPGATVVLCRAGVALSSRPHDPYPGLDGLLSSLRARTPHVYAIDAEPLLEQAGAPRAIGALLLGRAAALAVWPVDRSVLEAALTRAYSPSQRLAGVAAFRLGLEANAA